MNLEIKRIATSIAFAAAVLATAPPAIAQDDDDDPIAKAIKARQSGFQLYSYYAGTLFGMAKGEIPYDADTASTAASNFKAVTHLQNGSMWLPGSDNVARAGDTRAKPEIWAEGSNIGEKAKALKEASVAMADAAGGGLDSLRGAIEAVGDGCKGCHDDFRAKEY